MISLIVYFFDFYDSSLFEVHMSYAYFFFLLTLLSLLHYVANKLII